MVLDVMKFIENAVITVSFNLKITGISQLTNLVINYELLENLHPNMLLIECH